jgi:hypothetical protein
VSTTEFGDLGRLQGQGYFQPGENATSPIDDVLTFMGPIESDTPSDALQVDLYAGYGVFANGIRTGTFALTGAEMSSDTCGACVTLYTNATPQAHEDEYMPVSGTLEVTTAGDAVGGMFVGRITNVTFRHVIINPQSGATTPVNDGCATRITNATFSATLRAPQR